MANFLESITLGLCWWDVPSLILLIAAIAYVVVRKRSLKKELKELKGGRTA